MYGYTVNPIITVRILAQEVLGLGLESILPLAYRDELFALAAVINDGLTKHWSYFLLCDKEYKFINNAS